MSSWRDKQHITRRGRRQEEFRNSYRVRTASPPVGHADYAAGMAPWLPPGAPKSVPFLRAPNIAPVLGSRRDLTVVQYYTSKPNFVTLKRVESDVCLVAKGQVIPAQALAGRIVLLESADPGYDW